MAVKESVLIGINRDLLVHIDNLSRELEMYRADVIEFIISFYFAYVENQINEKKDD